MASQSLEIVFSHISGYQMVWQKRTGSEHEEARKFVFTHIMTEAPLPPASPLRYQEKRKANRVVVSG